MSLSSSLSFALNGSSCRKRSHDQISRSQSRSESPWRQAVAAARASLTPSVAPDLPNIHSTRTLPPPPARFAGDGFDYRMPIMSSNSESPSSTTNLQTTPPPPPPDVIDLTCDTDSPPSVPPPPPRLTSVDSDVRRRYRRSADRVESQSRDSRRNRHTQNGRPPRFGRNIMSGSPELIDLSAASDQIEESPEPFFDRVLPPVPLLPVDSSTGSSEVEFMGSRPLPQNAETVNVDNRSQAPASSIPHHLSQGLSRFRDLLAAGTSFMNSSGRQGLARAGTSRENPNEDPILEEHVQWVTRRVGNQFRVQPRQPRLPALIMQAPLGEENFDAIQFDYAQPAFALGGVMQGGAGSSTPDRRPEPPYKPPPAAAEGFTRKIEEDDVVVCVNCGDELGAGDGDVKQQVWVAKHCGHGYCGSCATNRSITKGGNKRDKRATTQRQTLGFKICKAPSCTKPVSHKTAMVQIYL